MNFERTAYGVLIGEKYLTASEGLDLLQWLAAEQEALLLECKEEEGAPVSGMDYEESSSDWSFAEVAEMLSEDEQIVGFEL